MLQTGDKIPLNLHGRYVTPHDAFVYAENKKDTQNLGQEFSLESFYSHGPIVLFFYPKDNTPGCSIEVQKFTALYPQIKNLGFEVIGCSRDNEVSHCKFIVKHQLQYTLLSDTSGAITEAFGIWGEKSFMGKKYMGITRSTFIISQDGTIIKDYPQVNVAKHPQEVLDFLKSL